VIKVAIAGCGKIADVHASQIQAIEACEIISVCDREELMAKQFAERFGVMKYFDDIRKLLEDTRPDVVHITTPPQSHFEIGKACLESGSHVYIEKPFTLVAKEAEELLKTAIARNLKVTVGNDMQFTHAARRMRKLVGEGFLGGPPVHMESYYCYDLGDASYVRALFSDKGHWVRDLPGKLLHNLISHGIGKITEFLGGEDPYVLAHGFTSGLLRSMGEKDVIDELRVIIRDSDDKTAYFTFSTQMRPAVHQFRIFGPRNGLLIDDDHETVIKERGGNYKSYLDKFIPPINTAKQYLGNFLHSARLFMGNDFHMSSGMRHLISSFYSSILTDSPVPIPYKQILLTARIMDDIFGQLEVAKKGRSEVGPDKKPKLA
jgi:predicted dehydrogenase